MSTMEARVIGLWTYPRSSMQMMTRMMKKIIMTIAMKTMTNSPTVKKGRSSHMRRLKLMFLSLEYQGLKSTTQSIGMMTMIMIVI